MARNGGLFSRRWRSPETEELGDVHVLAVDDSLVDRKVIERLLKITSCKVTAVESGWRALQYLGLDQEKTTDSELKVDLIITDYCMPGMTGYELLKKIKGSATFRQVPVVIMSSENVLARIDRCLEEGAEDFIVKPVKLADVKRLKDYMFGGTTTTTTTIPDNINKKAEEEKAISFNKRKLEQMSDASSASPSPPTPSPSTSPSPPPPDSPSSSPSSSSSFTPPYSPSQLESPTMRLKVANSSDQP